MIKKILASTLALALVFGMATVSNNFADFGTINFITASADNVESYEYQGWSYVSYTSDGTVYTQIYKYDGDSETVTIPAQINGKTVTSIDPTTAYGNGSIFRGTDVKKVIIPADFEGSINEKTFWAAKTITEISVEEGNPNYSSYDGMLFSKDMTELLDCPEGKSGKVVIPNGVKSLKGIDGNNNLGPFEDCNNITDIEIPDSVEYINDRTFRACKSLKEVHIPVNAEFCNGGYLGVSGAFYWCDSLESITVDSGNDKCGFVVDSGAVFNKDKTKLLYVPPKAKNISIPAEVTSIDYDSTLRQSMSKVFPNITVNENNTKFTIIGNGLYEKTDDGLSLVCYYSDADDFDIADNTVTIDLYGGGALLKFSRITIPEGVKRIGYLSFEENNSLMQVILPSTLEEIGQCAFAGCPNLKSITLPDIPVSDKDSYLGNIGALAIGYNIDYNTMKYVKMSDFIIYCNEGTDGERYAIENGFTYKKPGSDDSSSLPDSSSDTDPDSSSDNSSDISNDSSSDVSSDTTSNSDNSSTASSDSSSGANSVASNSKSSSASDKVSSSSTTNPHTGAAAAAFAGTALLGMAAVVATKKKK